MRWILYALLMSGCTCRRPAVQADDDAPQQQLPPGPPLPAGVIGYDGTEFAPIVPLPEPIEVLRRECPDLVAEISALKAAWRDSEGHLRIAYRSGADFLVCTCPTPGELDTVYEAWFHIVDAGAPAGRLEQVVDITNSNYDFAAVFWSRAEEPGPLGMSISYVIDDGGISARGQSSAQNWARFLPLVHPAVLDTSQADPVLIVLGADPPPSPSPKP